jgi:probable HAF family extracellular repeat protein
VVGTLTSDNHAFLYKRGKLKDLGATIPNEPWLNTSSAVAVNDSDEVVGHIDQFADVSVRELDAFLYKNGKMIVIAYGASDGDIGATVSGINNQGQVVGTYNPSNHYNVNAFLYRNGQLLDLGTLGGSFSSATGINGAGQIIGWADTSNATDAFLYQNGRMQAIGGKQSSYFIPAKINDHGEIAGFLEAQDGSSWHACRLFQTGTNAGVILSVDNLPVSASSVSTGINNGGEISGYCWIFAIGEGVRGIPFPGQVPAPTRINVRATPAGAIIGSQPNGVVGVIKAGPASAPRNPAILNDVTTPWWYVTFPSGVSGWVGQIVLGLTAPTQTGFIFKDEKMYDLSQIVPGWHINSANGVNDNKQIVCTAYRPGQTTLYALLLTLTGPGTPQITPIMP